MKTCWSIEHTLTNVSNTAIDIQMLCYWSLRTLSYNLVVWLWISSIPLIRQLFCNPFLYNPVQLIEMEKGLTI